MRVITFGTFDLFHIGHVNILERAKELGDSLIVGVSSDKLNYKKKGRYPVYSQDQRLQIINSLYCVDEVFVEESLEQKAEYLVEFRADILVMGDDWRGRFDEFKNLCEVISFPRTKDISTTDVIKMVKEHC